ncbi:putative transcriptional regulator [Frankia casuarinae]|jgi:transcriptional regulator with XRE-family HTH domain|uniref:Transcriptional regulator, XRE family n=1 Tax=Frankia casuarinae (strain DSM 45818 / CECT 9043 / HFP020203 / CcI3) TaxID=106370 RepID=Q2J5S5_FRACC|nr:helix-turn-helix domain-containing protein [Frankia casuarinae]ABD13367.1 transcriptional regulator, XRE family [Frankia casuarinae]EYT91816.1 putative transcriptional regulator [Frankia casuarinae]
MAKTRVDVNGLYGALDAARTARGLSWRQLAKEIEVSPSTMTRLANGHKPEVDAFVAMTRWLGMPAERFMLDDGDDERPQPELVAELAPLLRARKDLDAEDVRHLQEIIGSAVRRFNADRDARET